MKVAVLASGEGSNLQVLLDTVHGRDGIEVVAVASDQPAARALERAGAAGIATRVFPRRDFADRAARDAAIAAWSDDEHVEVQRDRYRSRLVRLRSQLGRLGWACDLPAGGFYLWVDARGDAWGLAGELAAKVGLVSSPGEFYGPAGSGLVRIAAVQPDSALDLIDERLDRLGV